jgi:hypothetical protein
MAAKPSATPRWANVGGIIVEPSAGKKDVGWLDNEEPPAEYFNWFQNLAWQWTQYLSDGDLSGNHTISGALAVGGTLDVDGGTALQEFTAATGQVGGDFTAQRLITPSRLYHGPTYVALPLNYGIAGTGGVSPWQFNSSGPPLWAGSPSAGAVLWFGIPAIFGSRILAYRVKLRNTVGGSISTSLVRVGGVVPPATETQIGATLNASTVETSFQYLVNELASPDNVFIQGNQRYVKIVSNNGTSGSTQVLGVEYQYDIPV